jgi:NYN domain
VDRCALFVDAGYVLADGAQAVHGTRPGDSVSWDYEGLLHFLAGLVAERTGLPLLRCYWYEATVDGRRTAEQDALADMPGIKLRVAKIRPGRREGVETEIHRDLTTLARNNAISDALVVSAEEDLAQVIADVQDLGMRVTLVHIAVDGNWTISRALRQESDDLIEIGGEQLRPYVELIAGAEPALPDDPDLADLAQARPLANGHAAGGPGSYQQMPAASGNHAPPSIYTAPVVAEYQRPALQLPRVAAPDRSREDRPRDDRPREDRPREDRPREDRGIPAAANGDAQAPAWQDTYAAPGSAPGPAPGPAPAGRSRPERQESAPQSPAARARAAEEAYAPGPQGAPEPVSGLAGVPGLPGPGPVLPEAAPAQGGQLRRLPSRSAGQGSTGAMGTPGTTLPQPGQHAGPSQGSARSGPFSGPQPVVTSQAPGYAPAGGISLTEAVQAAHEEGQEFGGSVARDAPALWLEAVLARKPRMPSDLEARLLQGSALPIDYLLHDEVRHALRRGFWDALERTRR